MVPSLIQERFTSALAPSDIFLRLALEDDT
jgi:hypothetical protein